MLFDEELAVFGALVVVVVAVCFVGPVGFVGGYNGLGYKADGYLFPIGGY